MPCMPSSFSVVKSHLRDLNPKPSVYETLALPIELRWRRLAVFSEPSGIIPRGIIDAPKAGVIYSAPFPHECVATNGALCGTAPGPYRLVDQDAALSRPKLGFESP